MPTTRNWYNDTNEIGSGGGGLSDGDLGDITVSDNGTVLTIDDDAVTYAKMQNVSATDKVLGRSTAGAGNVEEIACTAAGRAMIAAASAAAQTALLSAVTGDSGAGGVKGLVPAPATGDAAAGKYLKADGTWAVVSGGGTGDVVGPASATDNAVARFDTTSGDLLQNSPVTISDAGAVAGVTNITATSVTINGASDAVEQAIRANAGQTADIFQTQTSGGSALTKLKADGSVDIPAGTTYKINGTALASTNLADVSVVTGADDDFLQRKSGAWTNRTIAQVKTDLAASTSTAGVVELAVDSEVTTGSATDRAVTPDALAGSAIFGVKSVIVQLNGTTALTTSEKAYFRIPPSMTGMNLVSVRGACGTGAAGSSSSGTPTFTVKNVTDNQQMLSTSLTIDAGEYTSATAAAAVAINTTYDDVVTDDLIEVAVTTAGTGVTYATVTLGFQLP